MSGLYIHSSLRPPLVFRIKDVHFCHRGNYSSNAHAQKFNCDLVPDNPGYSLGVAVGVERRSVSRCFEY